MNLDLGFAAREAERKYFGAYYTPPSLACAVSGWVARSASDRLIEPSFGDGVFLTAAAERLQALGATLAQPQIFGTDIDPAAVRRVSSVMKVQGVPAALREADFLGIEPSGDWSGFDGAVGNPPYVRHHHIQAGTIADFRRRELGLSGGADLWCTFVMHSVRFLKPGGRLAFILPGSFCFANYAEEVRRRLIQAFSTTIAVRLAFSAFAKSGADERGVVVLCSGYQQGPSKGWVEQIAWDHEDLVGKLATPVEDALKVSSEMRSWQPQVDIHHRRLGDLGRISIGFVTGANRSFIIPRSTVEAYDLPPASLAPVVARTAQTRGILFSEADHEQAAAGDGRVFLFAPSELGERHGPVRRFLATIPPSVRRKTSWFKKRPLWYRPDIGPRPDAVITYMNHLGPRLVLLSGARGATNTFHAITFNRAEGDPSPELIALAMLTSCAQLSAERVGRSYGGGVLKIEPSEARRIVIPCPSAEPADLPAAFMQADRLLKEGDPESACSIADDTILKPMLGKNYSTVRAHLMAELAAARSFRHQISASSSTAVS